MLTDKEREQFEALSAKASLGEEAAITEFFDALGGANEFKATIEAIKARCAPGSVVDVQMNNLGIVFGSLVTQAEAKYPPKPADEAAKSKAKK